MRVRLLVGATLLAVTLFLAVGAPSPTTRAQEPIRSTAVTTALRESPRAVQKVWVFFRDKGPDAAARMNTIAISPRAQARRALRGTTRGLTWEDVPLAPSYVAQVSASVARVRQQVAWLNAMSVEATAEQIAAIEALPFVARIDLVRGYRRRTTRRAEPTRAGRAPAAKAATAAPVLVDYGPSAGQLTQIGVPGLHDDGAARRGRDGGRVRHRVRQPVPRGLRRHVHRGPPRLRQRRRRRGERRDRGEGSHGTETLSVLGGLAPASLIGPAFNATFLLAKTEDTSSETPVEEDNWAAAAEWAEARAPTSSAARSAT